jgi:hypothetical protein
MLGAGGSQLNPCHSGGRNQEDCGLKPARSCLKKPFTKKGWWSGSRCSRSSSPSAEKKKKKKRIRNILLGRLLNQSLDNYEQ